MNLLSKRFLFEELVKRDFKKKYKRTILGTLWSVLYPLIMLFVMRLIFSNFFGRNIENYTIYLFCGSMLFSYFSEATSQGMFAFRDNASILTKINVSKYIFLLSKNIQVLFNFSITLVVFIIFCIIENIQFSWGFLFLIYPIVLLTIFNFGVGLFLSSSLVFFRDIQYLWAIFVNLLVYVSAIFYSIDILPANLQSLFWLNPLYLFITYFRSVVIEGLVPSMILHTALLIYTFIVNLIGYYIYKKYNSQFLYYL